MNEISTTLKKRGRLMYIFEAALEYFIAILVAGSFLATLTKELGFSDSLTGILSSIISLGFIFQLISVLIRPKKSKRFIIVLSVINQLLFMFIYIIPLLNINKTPKAFIFIATIIVAYLIYYIAHPKKINWFMSLVDDNKRGNFTAKKEIFSLITGIIFSFSLGAVSDYFKEKGQINTYFVISAIVIFLIMLSHTLTMLFTPEESSNVVQKKKLLANIKEVLGNKKLLILIGAFVIYHIANGFTIPFYGTYAINELGLSLTAITVITIAQSLSRISVSGFLGKYADKKSFADMIQICLISLAASYICIVFSGNGFGKIMYFMYHVFYGIAAAGINSSLMNMVFDYVSVDKRADSYAISQAVSGVFGFLSTLLGGVLVSYIQRSGNTLFGISVYAQQVTSLIGAVFVLITILYVRKFLMVRSK